MISFHPDMQVSDPGTCFGALMVRDFCPTPEGRAAFGSYAQKELSKVREQWAGFDRKQLGTAREEMAAYVKYYKKFKKTYHVLLQMESVLHGKELPDTLPAVQIMFLTELQTGMLLSVQDFDKVQAPETILRARGDETFLSADGRDITVKKGDISVADREGITMSIVYGQDERTRIREDSRNVFYILNGVPGIPRETYEKTLMQLVENLKVLQPDVQPEYMAVLEV